jgi:ATP synthase protein I
MWRGGVVPAVVVGALVAAGSAAAGGRAAGSAAIGAVITVAAMSTGPGLMSISQHWSPPAVMASALGGYAITVLVLAVAFVLLAPISWLSGEHVGAAMVAVVIAWMAGQTRAASKLRILAYGSGTQGDERAGTSGQTGSPASPSEPSH